MTHLRALTLLSLLLADASLASRASVAAALEGLPESPLRAPVDHVLDAARGLSDRLPGAEFLEAMEGEVAVEWWRAAWGRP